MKNKSGKSGKSGNSGKSGKSGKSEKIKNPELSANRPVSYIFQVYLVSSAIYRRSWSERSSVHLFWWFSKIFLLKISPDFPDFPDFSPDRCSFLEKHADQKISVLPGWYNYKQATLKRWQHKKSIFDTFFALWKWEKYHRFQINPKSEFCTIVIFPHSKSTSTSTEMSWVPGNNVQYSCWSILTF